MGKTYICTYIGKWNVLLGIALVLVCHDLSKPSSSPSGHLQDEFLGLGLRA